MPRVGFEPTLPCGKRILSPPRLPFRHPRRGARLNVTLRKTAVPAACPMQAGTAVPSIAGGDGRIRTAEIGVLQTPALDHLATSPSYFWCRGGDLNSYALTGTAPSRQRVYRFHHLGTGLSLWQGREDSNPGPAVLETAALPAELHPTYNIRSTCQSSIRQDGASIL